MAEKKEKKEITIMDLPGVGAATAEKLKDSGYETMLAIAVASPGELVETAGFTEATARKVIQAARNELKMGFESGEDLLKKREMITKLNTGSSALNSIMGGGIESGAITEFFGEFGSGKSSIAHQLAVSVQLPKEKGGVEGMAVWLDSESTFRPERIKQIAEANGLDYSQTLKNIKVARCFNSDHQMLLAEKIEDLITKEQLPIKLIIVDSLMSHFRADFSGRAQLADRQQKVNKHMHILLKLATTYNIAVYVTNQVMAKPDTFFGDPTAAIGGHIVGHNCVASNTLLQLSDGTIRPIADSYDFNELICVKFKEGMLIAKNKFNNFFVNINAKKLLSIDAGYKIEASPDHRFFKITDEADIVEVKASTLNIGDFVACAKKIDIPGEVIELPEIKLKNVYKITNEAKNIIYNKINESNLSRSEICNDLSISPRQLRRVLNQEYPTYEETVKSISDKFMLEPSQIAVQAYTNKHKEITIPKYFTENICQILGYFVGDGNFENHSLRFRDARIEVVEHYSNLFHKEFNINGRIHKIRDKNCFNLDINSKALNELFREVDKNLITYISRLPSKYVASFIRGFTDAEGYVSKKRAWISISQKDELFLRCIQMLLLRFEIKSTLTKLKSKKSNELYNLVLIGSDAVDFYVRIGLTATDKRMSIERWVEYYKDIKYNRKFIPIKRTYLQKLFKMASLKPSKILKPRTKDYTYINLDNLNKVLSYFDNKTDISMEIKNEISKIKALVDSDIEWRKIREIKERINKEPLYDIAVPGPENYIANGFISHNSTYRVYLRKGKKGTRVAKLIDAPHLADAEAIFMVTEQGIKDV